MKCGSLAVGVAVFVAASPIAVGADTTPQASSTRLETYGHLPSVEDMALSPSGTRLAFVRTEGDARMIALFSLTEGKLIGGLNAGKQKLRGIRWADDDRLMITTSTTGVPRGMSGNTSELFMLQVHDLRNRRSILLPQPLTDGHGGIVNVITGRVQVRRVDGHTVLFIPGVYLAGRALPGLFRFDLDTGREKLAVAGNETARGWLVDANGVIAAEKDYDERGQRWAIRIHRDRGLADVSSGQEPIESPELLGFGMQPDTLLVSSLELGDPVWRLLSMKDGTLGPPMVERKLFDAPIEERLTSRLIGGVHRADDAKYTFFDADKEARWQRIARTFPGERVRFISATDDYSRFVVLVEGPRHGYQYELVDIDQNTVGPLNDVYPGIGAPYEVRAINYAAADGLQIPAYLTLPRGKPEKGLPLIVLPHGGPAVRDTAEFDWWSQALADQGYLVLRPNYRGSSLGWKFISAGFGQWGRKMQSDLSDGVRHLVHEGLVDPARVCIVGASYGGYAALAGVTLDPGVYRCAVSVAGIGDPARMLEREQDKVSFDKRAVRYWDRFMGATGAKDPALDAISPIRHIDAVTVPVLLIHGRDDTVVPYEQSEQMYKALHRAGKVVELVSLKHEDHWLSGSQTRLQMLEATVRFLRKYNPPE